MLNQTSFLKHIWGTVLHCSRVFDRPRGSVSLFFTVGSYHLMQIEVLPQIGQSVYNTRYLWVCKKPRLPKRFSKRPRVCNQKLKVVYIYIYIARDSDHSWISFIFGNLPIRWWLPQIFHCEIHISINETETKVWVGRLLHHGLFLS